MAMLRRSFRALMFLIVFLPSTIQTGWWDHPFAHSLNLLSGCGALYYIGKLIRHHDSAAKVQENVVLRDLMYSQKYAFCALLFVVLYTNYSIANEIEDVTQASSKST